MRSDVFKVTDKYQENLTVSQNTVFRHTKLIFDQFKITSELREFNKLRAPQTCVRSAELIVDIIINIIHIQ